MADEVTKLKRSRAGIKAYVTKIEKTIEDALTADVSDKSQITVEALVTNYADKLKNIKIVDDKIADLLVDNENAFNDEISKAMEYHEKSYTIFAAVNAYKKTADVATPDNKADVATAVAATASSSSSSSATSLLPHVDGIRPPRLELDKFDGDALKWQEFWDQFEVGFHNNKKLTDIEKFSYLKRFLKGIALSTVSGLKLTAQNYAEAVTLLEERFGNKQYQITAHMKALTSLKPVKKMTDVTSLRKLYNDVVNSVRNLKALDVETGTFGSLLVPILAEKIPEKMQRIISRKFGSDPWVYDEMIEYLNDEIQATERCAAFVIDSDDEEDDTSPFSTSSMTVHGRHGDRRGRFQDGDRRGSREDHRGRFQDNDRGGRRDNDRGDRKDSNKCVYCWKEHPSSQCKTVTNVASRRSILRKFARCFNCLQKNHRVDSCYAKYRCRKCKEKHHISICEKEKPPDEKQDQNADNTTNCHVGTNVSETIYLHTAKAELLAVGSKGSTEARLLFDTGSHHSFITEEIVAKLKLKSIRKRWMLVNIFGKVEGELQELKVVQFRVKNKTENSFVYVEAFCVPVICNPLTGQSVERAKEKFPHLASLVLADCSADGEEMHVDVLIGMNFYYSFMSPDEIIRGKSGPFAVKSTLGYILGGGGVSIDGSPSCMITHTLQITSVDDVTGGDCENDKGADDEDIREFLKKFWAIDAVGLKGAEDCVIHSFEKDIKFNGERYVTKLPFRPDHELLPDNFGISRNRLAALMKRFQNEPELRKDYRDIFHQYEKEGIIERVPESELAKEAGSVYYIPHHPVVREDKETTKIRPVFDASSSKNKLSLNDCLYAGPNLLPKIFDILLRFRFNYVAILADIQKAFLNVEIAPEHRDFLRFLLEVKENDEEEAKVGVFRFIRVVFGVKSSPFLLNGTIRHHLEKYLESDRELVEKLLEDLYVDDETSGCESVDEGAQFYKDAKKIMSEAGFNLRKWVTNNPELQEIINQSEGIADTQKDDLTYSEVQFKSDNQLKSVLGVKWDTVTDEFVFDLEVYVKLAANLAQTKRNVLRVAASIYDPLGFISPITTKFKIIFQLLCEDKRGWDEISPPEINVLWKEVLSEMQEIKSVRIPRYASYEIKHKIRSVDLHGFADSSMKAYAAIVYIRIVTEDGVRVQFLASKSRVAPLKGYTIPRLELLGCKLLTELIAEVKTSIQSRISIDETYAWTDSKVALCWVKGKSKAWNVWVENKVVPIRKIVPAEFWFHVSTDSNPADIPTRADKVKDMMDGLFFDGPKFLHNEEFKVEKFDAGEMTNDPDVLTESKKQQTMAGLVMEVPSRGLHNVIDVTRYSSMRRLLVVTGVVFRAVKKFMRKSDIPSGDVNISLNEYTNVRNLWIKEEQAEMEKDTGKFKQTKASLKLFQDEGFWRLRGRFGRSVLKHTEKYPILLRNGSYFTKLVILEAHVEVMHSGIEATLTSIQSSYWFAKSKRTVKNLLRKCVGCKKIQGRTIVPPPTPDLPDFRVNAARAFQATGLDFAGPLHTKDVEDCYVLLFTCATSRAIHLELTPSLKAPAYIRAFIRFSARRGNPDMILSDNAKTFKSKEAKRYMVPQGIQQKFNLPASPWWGGFYERLVRTVKTTLMKSIGKAFLTFEELQTVLCQIEKVINGRPLLYTSEDDLHGTITPFHLMYGTNLLCPDKHSRTQEPEQLSYVGATKRARYLNKIVEEYWRRFSSTYLNELRRRHSYVKGKTSIENKLHVGDVVLIRDDNMTPRMKWRTGRVDKLVIGQDGYVRGAELTLISNKGKRTKASRPVQKLIPFEIVSDEHDNSRNDNPRDDDSHNKNSRNDNDNSRDEHDNSRNDNPRDDDSHNKNSRNDNDNSRDDNDNSRDDNDNSQDDNSNERRYTNELNRRPQRKAARAGEARRRGEDVDNRK